MTQLSILQSAFNRGESLSVAEALTKYGIYALSQRCTDLRRLGYPVDKVMEKTSTGKHIARYSRFMVPYG